MRRVNTAVIQGSWNLWVSFTKIIKTKPPRTRILPCSVYFLPAEKSTVINWNVRRAIFLRPCSSSISWLAEDLRQSRVSRLPWRTFGFCTGLRLRGVAAWRSLVQNVNAYAWRIVDTLVHAVKILLLLVHFFIHGTVRYLAKFLRGRPGYEVLDNQRGA